ESANALVEGKAAIVARINELLDRPTETAVMNPVISRKLVRAALDSGALTGFVSRNLGASVDDFPFPTLPELQSLAVALNPGLRAKATMAAVANTELELARKEHLPDIDVSLQYGQRSGFTRGADGNPTSRSDLISAVVSIPIPVQRKSKQDVDVAAARAISSGASNEERAAQNQIRSEVARIYSDVAHQRTLLALFVRSVIPQGRASTTSAMSNYQAGRGDLTSVLNAQATVFDLELAYQRALADFAEKVAELEAVSGKELIP
ncbi:MAG: TolC family protein, partial [Gemmatimonadales bacterium]